MQKKYKYLYFIAFYAIFLVNVSAQNSDSLIFQSLSTRSVGLGFPALNYSLLSPLNHSGYSIAFLSTRFREKTEKHLTQLDTHFELGSLYNYANDSYITMLNFKGAWSNHFCVSDSKRPLRLLLGATADVGINVCMKDDNTNNPVAYLFNLSISPSMLVKYRFNIDESTFVLGQQIEAPLFSLISSSDYSTPLPIGIAEKEANFIDAMRLTSLGSLKKCTTITTLDISGSLQQQKKMPVIRISYIFSGVNYKNKDFTIKSVNHLIVFGAIFHLFR